MDKVNELIFLFVNLKTSDLVKSERCLSPVSFKKNVMQCMNCRSQTGRASYKVLSSVLCYFYPPEVAVMLSQITVIVCPEIDITLSKLG